MTKKKRVSYSEKVGKAICEEIATSNKTLEEISKLKGMPSHYTISKWANGGQYPEFAEIYNAAYKVRVNSWVEERDKLSRHTLKLKTPKQIADEYDLWADVRTEKEIKDNAPEKLVYDLRLVNKFVSEDIKNRQNQVRQRLDILTRNIGQIASMYDKRFTESKKIEGDIKTGFTIEMVSIDKPEPKAIDGEVIE